MSQNFSVMDHPTHQRDRSPMVHGLVGAAAAIFIVALAAVLGGFDFSSADTIVNNPGGDARGLARTVAELGVAPPVTDEELTSIVETLRAMAVDGDIAAARFVAELARHQRAVGAPGESESAEEFATSNP